MPSPDILNFEELVAPIPGESPSGIDLHKDFSPGAVFQALKDAAKMAHEAANKKRQGDSKAEPNWSPILDGVREILAGKSKDIELATWLVEGLFQRYGFPGLRDGLRLVRELAERYWECLHPVIEEDRAAAIAKLAVVADQIKWVPLTDPNASVGPFARWQYQQADSLEALSDPEKRESRLAEGYVSHEMIAKAEAATSLEFARQVADDVAQSMAELGKLEAVLEEKCGKDSSGQSRAPSMGDIRKALEDCQGIVEGMITAKSPATNGTEAEHTPPEDGGGESAKKGPGMMRNRQEAFQTLLQVAQFFRQTEPHSPVSYALERIVRWGKMSLPDLLAELIAETGARSEVFKLVGIQEGGSGEAGPSS